MDGEAAVDVRGACMLGLINPLFDLTLVDFHLRLDERGLLSNALPRRLKHL